MKNFYALKENQSLAIKCCKLVIYGIPFQSTELKGQSKLLKQVFYTVNPCNTLK